MQYNSSYPYFQKLTRTALSKFIPIAHKVTSTYLMKCIDFPAQAISASYMVMVIIITSSILEDLGIYYWWVDTLSLCTFEQ